jgi:hypothetical protein
MERFKMESENIMRAIRSLFRILGPNNNQPFSFSVEGFNHVVIPQAAYKTLELFRPDKMYNTIVTEEDFCNFEVVETEKAEFSISINGRPGLISIELLSEYKGLRRIIGDLSSSYIGSMFEQHNSVINHTPLDFSKEGDKKEPVVRYYCLFVTMYMVTGLTLIYNFLNYGDKLKVNGERNKEKALEYFHSIVEKMKGIGDSFVEAVENLSVLDILWR